MGEHILLPDRNTSLLRLVHENNVRAILEFTRHLKRKSYSDRRIMKYGVIMRKMTSIGMNPRYITPDQIDSFFFHLIGDGYSDETQKDYWLMFRKICTFYRPELEKQFKKYRIRTTDKKVDILSIGEVNRMIQSCKCLRHKVILSLLYEGGFRSGELRGITKGDVTFDEHGALVTVIGKTGIRKVRIIRASAMLKRLLEKNPNPFDFSSQFLNNKVVKKIARRCGIQKRVYPHLFRHTRATHLARFLTDREMCIFFGWSRKSDMPSHYAHLSGRDVDEKIIALEGG